MNSDFDKYLALNHWQLDSLKFFFTKIKLSYRVCGLCGKFVSNNNDYPKQNY